LRLESAQAQEQDDGGDRGGGDAQRKHYEHELHYWHSPVCKRLVGLHSRTREGGSLAIYSDCKPGSN
jgi:hypothetical protein